MSNQPWTKKYSPNSLSDIYGQNKALDELKEFVINYKQKKQKAALLYGEPGCGKTSSVHAIAKELDLEIHEVNASDARNKDSLNQILGSIMGQQSLFFKKKLILVDEVDGVSGKDDRGGLNALSKLIDKTTFPIIMTANNPYDKKFSDLRKKSLMIEFHGLRYPTILTVLRKICENEKVEYDDMALTGVARRAGGDLRGAITDLQLLTQGTNKLKIEDLEDLSDRKKTESMIGALMKVFKTVKPEVSLPSFENISESNDDVFLWMEENIPKEYLKPKDLALALDNLSLADVFRKRIKRRQHWRFLVYINSLLTAGISLSKDEKYPGYTKYEPTKRILKQWQAKMKYEKRKIISEKIAKKTHTSIKYTIKHVIPYIKIIFKKNPIQSKKMTDEFDLSSDEIKWLKM